MLFSFHTTENLKKLSMLLMMASLTLLSSVYQNLNLTIYNWDLYGGNFNILLSNSINKFHPALFYGSLLVVILSQFSSLHLKSTYFGRSHSLYLLSYYTLYIVPLIIFTLSLGSWWAAQEGSWGGWWNWDASEVFGLIIMLIHLNTLHKLFHKNNHTLNVVYLRKIWTLALIVYVFIQFNFELVSHNFGTRSDQFIDTSHNFLAAIVLTFLIAYLFYRFSNYLYLSNKVLGGSRTEIKNIQWQIIVITVTLYILTLSFNTLLNDFFWKIFQVNVFNSMPLVTYFTYSILSVLLIRLWSPTISLSQLGFIFSYSINCWLVTTFMVGVTLNSLFHVSVTAMLLNTCDEHTSTISFWGYVYQNMVVTDYKTISDLDNVYLTVNNFFVEVFNLASNNGSVMETAYNVIWSASSTENHSFSHAMSSWAFEQTLYSGVNLTPYMIKVGDLAVASTSIITLLLFTQIKPLILTNNRIMF